MATQTRRQRAPHPIGALTDELSRLITTYANEHADYGRDYDTLRGAIQGAAVEAAGSLVDSAADTLESGGGSAWEPAREPHEHSIWTDLRVSEATRLMELVSEAIDRAAERCEAIVLDELIGAGVRFVSELKFPDEPRRRSDEPRRRSVAPTA